MKYDQAAFTEEYGIHPRFWIDVMALQGDSTDNIPGVYQIGKKRALQLVTKYGTIENVFGHASEVCFSFRNKK